MDNINQYKKTYYKKLIKDGSLILIFLLLPLTLISFIKDDMFINIGATGIIAIIICYIAYCGLVLSIIYETSHNTFLYLILKRNIKYQGIYFRYETYGKYVIIYDHSHEYDYYPTSGEIDVEIFDDIILRCNKSETKRKIILRETSTK